MLQINNKNIIDISIYIDQNTVVYPGNPKVEFEKVEEIPKNRHNLSKIIFGAHTATHLDAPSHSIFDGKNINEISLDNFIGDALVVDCLHIRPGEAISLSDVEKLVDIKGKRILFKTCNSERGFKEFYNDFVYLSPEASQFLAENQTALIGIDAFSVKQKGNIDDRPHTFLLEKNIPILEGIDLSLVLPGEYTLVALPLKFIGIEASPCRAILIK
jgi:arylformamidase